MHCTNYWWWSCYIELFCSCYWKIFCASIIVINGKDIEVDKKCLEELVGIITFY